MTPSTLRTHSPLDPWQRAIADYIGSLRAAGRPSTTITLYRHYANLMAGKLGTPSPWTVTARQLEQFLGEISWGLAARKSLRTVVGGFYGWGHVTGRIQADPSIGLPRVKVSRGRPRPTPEGIFLDALAAAGRRERLMLELAGLAGLRAGEIARVHSDDLYDDVLLVHGKGGKDRRVPMPEGDLTAAIAGASGWLFPNGRGGHLTPNHVSKLVSALLPGQWTCHTLRHRFGTRAFAGSRDLLAVSTLLGHASADTTIIYVQMPDDHLRDAVRAAAPIAPATTHTSQDRPEIDTGGQRRPGGRETSQAERSSFGGRAAYLTGPVSCAGCRETGPRDLNQSVLC